MHGRIISIVSDASYIEEYDNACDDWLAEYYGNAVDYVIKRENSGEFINELAEDLDWAFGECDRPNLKSPYTLTEVDVANFKKRLKEKVSYTYENRVKPQLRIIEEYLKSDHLTPETPFSGYDATSIFDQYSSIKIMIDGDSRDQAASLHELEAGMIVLETFDFHF